jgi:hypothetical protein
MSMHLLLLIPLPQGLSGIEISGPDYLADLRAFRNEMNTRKAFWRQKLLSKKLVLSSDPMAKSPKVPLIGCAL